MKPSDLVLDSIFWLSVAGASTITVGTVLMILDEGLYLNKKRALAAQAERLAVYEAEGRLYREQERVRIHARRGEVVK